MKKKPSAINVIWLWLILISLLAAGYTGKMQETILASFNSAKVAAGLAINLIGVMALWLGLMKVAEAGGLLRLVARAMRPLVGPEKFVVPLQNGVEAPSQLAAALGADHVLGGLCRIVSQIVEPGHVRHAGLEPYVALGELDNRPSVRIRLFQLYSASGHG